MEKITIVDKQLKDGKWTLTGADGKKYGFWERKKDGTPTKAFQQFSKYQLGTGMTVDAEVKQNPYTDSKGTARIGLNILYFRADEYGTPQVQAAPQAVQYQEPAGNQFLVKQMNDLAKRVAKLEGTGFGAKEVIEPATTLPDLVPPEEEIKDDIKPSDIPF